MDVPVLRDGDTVRASGRVVAVDGAVWFDPPLPVPLVGYNPGQEPAPLPSGLGVPAVGVDLANLDRRRERDGAVEGWARLTGAWQQSRLVVSDQGPPAWPREDFPQWTQPPCPAPVGGWPAGDPDENLDVPTVDSLAVTSIALFRPSNRQVVLVVSTEDPQRAEEALRPHVGARLCVVASRWTRDEIDSVTERLRTEMPGWLIYTFGTSTDEDGQPSITADVTHVRPGLADWARGLPDGLLTLHAWLKPDRWIENESTSATVRG